MTEGEAMRKFTVTFLSLMIVSHVVFAESKSEKRKPQSAERQTIQASADEKYDLLNRIFGEIHRFDLPDSSPDRDDGATISIFQTGGGDPAMNGNRLIISICPNRFQEHACATFPDVMDINSIRRASLNAASKTLVLQVSADRLNQDGEIKSARVRYNIRFGINSDGSVQPQLRVTKK
jgi:hypothetical protein